MRAHELVPEELQPEIHNFEPFRKEYKIGDLNYMVELEVARLSRWLHVKVFDENQIEVAWIDFEVVGNNLVSLDTFVLPQYRRQGIATQMYKLAKDLGNDVLPSQYQSRAGKKMWKGMTAKGSLDEDEANTITLWHGGKDLEHTHQEVTSSKKGRWAHGPGLYLTNSYNRALQYAKGSRKVYRVTINRGTDISKVRLPYADIAEFANGFMSSSKRKQFMMYIEDNMKRMGTEDVPASVYLNLIINFELVPSAKTSAVANFLVRHGVDYAIESFGGFENEKVVVVFNRSKIVSVTPVVPKTITGSDFDIKDVARESK